jgi:hypothetical protein
MDQPPIVETISEGFKVVDAGTGPAFFCDKCGVEVDP